MYSTTWCGYCRRLKLQLDEAGIAYREIDIERNPDAATFRREGQQRQPDRADHAVTRTAAPQPTPASLRSKPHWRPRSPRLAGVGATGRVGATGPRQTTGRVGATGPRQATGRGRWASGLTLGAAAELRGSAAEQGAHSLATGYGLAAAQPPRMARAQSRRDPVERLQVGPAPSGPRRAAGHAAHPSRCFSR